MDEILMSVGHAMENHREKNAPTANHAYTRLAGERIASLTANALGECRSRGQSSFLLCVEYDSVDVEISSDVLSSVIVRPPGDLMSEVSVLQDVEIIVTVSAHPGEGLDVDGHTLSSGDPEHARNIIVCINAQVGSSVHLETVRAEILATAVHELRHAIQYIVWEWDRDHLEPDTEALEHLYARHEVDARVEEICSGSTLPLASLERGTFVALAIRHLRRWVQRNLPAVEHAEACDLVERAVRVHADYFDKRRSTLEMSVPKADLDIGFYPHPDI